MGTSPNLRRRPRPIRPRGALVALIALLPLLGTACGSDGDVTRIGEQPDGPLSPPEQVENGRLRLDAATVSGRLDGRALVVEVPVEALESGSGSLWASLRSVDGTQVHSSVQLPFDVSRGERTTLEARLSFPAAIEAQPRLVEYNLVVRGERGLRLTKSALHVVPPYEVRLEGPARVSEDKQVSYRLAARHAITRAPLADQAITVSVAGSDGQPESHVVTTDESGTAALELTLQGPGERAVTASAAAYGVPAEVDEPVEVEPVASRVLLTTDKPLYQPGQTIHLRALSLSRSDRSPNQSASVRFEIEDGKGNKILQRDLEADAYGIASTDFTLGNILNEGTFAVRAISGDSTTERSVTVTRYALPKYRIGIQTDQPFYLPGNTVTAELDARYFFGRPVANAQVTVELGALVVGEQIFERVQARTDAEGRLQVSLALPSALPGLDIGSGNAVAFLRVTALDSAGQEVAVERALTVAAQPLRISAVPESGKLVPGVENRLQLFVTDPLGNPQPAAALSVTLAGAAQTLTTDGFGYAELSWTPSDSQGPVQVEARVGDEVVRESFGFERQTGGQTPVLVRTDRAVYEVGDDVEVEIVAPGSGLVYVDWLNDGQAVDMRTLRAEDGIARLSVPVDTSLLGDNRIEAYVVDDNGNIVRAGRTVFARGSSSLSIDVSTDAPLYAPGETATLTFNVKDDEGQPQAAALGVQIVDEAVFAIVDAQPGLLRTYFELEDEFAQPSYQLRAPGGNLGRLLLDETNAPDEGERDAAQRRAAANLAALGDSPVMGLSSGSWQGVVTRSNQLLEPYLATGKAALVGPLTEAVGEAIRWLDDQGCSRESYWCDSLQQAYVDALKAEVAERFHAIDFWGSPYDNQPMSYDEVARLVSPGPDEIPGSSDDVSIRLTFADIDTDLLARTVPGANPQAGGVIVDFDVPQNADNAVEEAGNDGAGGTGSAGPPNTSGEDEAGPRVRQDFPETLYVNPAIITDGTGTASIEVPLADSITEWRVSTLGHTQSGLLGGSSSGITVFQDFFVDVNFPATLTRGDEVDFPIAVYNYLDVAQSVDLELEAASWYTPLGSTTLSLDLGPGEVRGVSFPVRVDEVGLQTLTLTGTGTEKADAVARRVRVVPDGLLVPEVLSGSLEPGSASHTLSFPAAAVPGSEQMFLQVFPAFLAQAVSGMDSVLQVPSGCFEQTTSTTWPNVLVTDYMQATDQITPEIQLRAESLISAGYQRLLTFEHPGGGFSWFGTQDPAPFLSVTAFGLMEFADMKAVHPIDEAMLARTQEWLVNQQQADGSWQGDQSEFFSFHTSGVRNTAFVLWALAENGYNGPALSRGLDYVKANLAGGDVSERDDPYTLALVANAMVLVGDSDADNLLDRLDGLKQTDGDKFFWGTNLQTNFYGGGNDANVSATALVTHAMVRDGSYPATVEGALAYITAAKDQNGNFGSTQATTWSLKTLLLAAKRGTDGSEGTLSVSVDGSEFAQVTLRPEEADVMTTVDMSSLATTGDHVVDLDFVGTGRLSYSLVGRHHVPWESVPEPAPGPLSIELSYDAEELSVDDTVTATVRVTNNTDAPTNMVLVTLGVPPGFEVQLGDFDSYLQSNVLSKAEIAGRQLNLYLTELGASATQAFEYRLLATMPVRASDGGAEASLYYEPDQKTQAPATTLVANAP